MFHCLQDTKGGDWNGERNQKKTEHLHIEMMKSTSLEARPWHQRRRV
jgi:hypothetical protein